MPAFSASAPGKVILFGEHAVVYHRPAIAVPVNLVKAKAVVLARPASQAGQIEIEAADIGLKSLLTELPATHPLHILITGIQSLLGIDRFPAFLLRITSDIPIAAGMGSGAAVSVAAARAITAFLGKPQTDEVISALAFEVEKAYHGTPSGIDNTVITFDRPVFFQHGQPIDFIQVGKPFTLVIGHSGIQSQTGSVVAAVRTAWQENPQYYEKAFDAIGLIVGRARQALEEGCIAALGELMTENHRLLQSIQVSCPELDHLVDVAHQAGALGAKLSGAGRGGNIIALASTQDEATHIASALRSANASRTIVTNIQSAR